MVCLFVILKFSVISCVDSVFILCSILHITILERGSCCLVRSASVNWYLGSGQCPSSWVLPGLWEPPCLWDSCASFWLKGSRLHCTAHWLFLTQTPVLPPSSSHTCRIHTVVLHWPVLPATIILVPKVPAPCHQTESPELPRTWERRTCCHMFSARTLGISLTFFFNRLHIHIVQNSKSTNGVPL